MHPILVTNSGLVKGMIFFSDIKASYTSFFLGSHRCKVNRRYADPKIKPGSRGPEKFEVDAFWNVPYAQHLDRFEYGLYPHPKVRKNSFMIR